ncbi:hypothetical protein [Streptomyces lunalinharesii]|uniref:Proteinase inhibitor I42 chagasin domain-containing protein n=1 Tax=Streptomyces lunalinharesii TaxID=333384 RepID=A0ABN3RI31_9ACTN
MKEMRQLTAVCVAVAVLSAGTACATAQATPVPTAHRIELTDRDAGRAVTVHPGDAVEVRLTGVRDRGTTFAWSAPAAEDPAVLRRSALGRTPTGGVTARFTAGGPGGTALTARRSCRAASGSRCPHVVVAWRVTVTVR